MSTQRKLTRAERKQIEAAIARAKNQDKKKKSAQDSIPFERMWPDGICRVKPGYFTKTVQFQDINYQLNQNEDKTAIFEGWCDFLNYFDSSVKFQLSFMNMAANKDTYGQSIEIPPQGDDFDDIRQEYTEMLRNQLARGNNGLIKTKYLTFGIEAANVRVAKPRLERIETDILNNFKRLGVSATSMNGKERLALMHGMFHMDEQIDFSFSWDWLAPSGLSVKDFIAPSSFSFRNGKTFGVGKKMGAVSFLQILAPELNDRMLADFLDMESSLIVTMHIQFVDQTKAIRTIKRKITDLQKMTIEEQKKAVRAGYDMDIIPSDLATYGNEAKKLLQDLQSRNERMFLMTFLVLNTADTKQQLDNNVFQASSIAQKYNCQLTRLDFQQEEGLMSSLPLGLNQIEITRGLTTSSVAIFVPFTTQELFQTGKEALYCGINALSNNLSGKHLERNLLTTVFPDPYSHRLKIIGDTVQCSIHICANGNVSFSEMLEWDTTDKLAFGNILEFHLTDIVNNHNDNCVILCSETNRLKTAQYGKYYLNWQPCQKIAFQVQELLYQKIFDLRHKAKALFPNVPVSQIIEEIPLPIDYDAELKLYEDIYNGFEYYNEEIAHVLHEPKSSYQYTKRLAQFYLAVRWCLKDTKTRRMPLYLLGDENDIKFSTPFLKLWKLNEETDIQKDNIKNFRCDLQNNGQIYYGEFDDGIKPGWDENELSTNIQQGMEKIIERQQCV